MIVHHPQTFFPLFSFPPASAPLLLESPTSVPHYTVDYPHSVPADPACSPWPDFPLSIFDPFLDIIDLKFAAYQQNSPSFLEFRLLVPANVQRSGARRTSLADRGDGGLWPGSQKQNTVIIHGSESRSGDARVPERAWYIPSTLVGIEFPAGVGRDNCAGTCAVVCRGEWGRERASHSNAAHGYGSRLATRGHRRCQVPVLLRDNFRIWEDFMWYCDIAETHLLKISFCDYRGTSSRVAVRSSGTASNGLIRWLGPLSVTVYTAIAKWRTGNKLVHFHRN